MRLRYSTQDIFWNKDNEIKPNKNGFNNYLNSMRNATNFNVNYVSELSIKITVPVNEIWKFIEIDDEKNNKFSKRYYVLGTITKKNNINCECIFVVDIWCSFILNNFDKFYTNRTNDITQPLLPNNSEYLVPKTSLNRYEWYSIPSLDSSDLIPYTPASQVDQYETLKKVNTNFIHIFYDTKECSYFYVFNPGTGLKYYGTETKYDPDTVLTSKTIKELISKSANLVRTWKESNPNYNPEKPELAPQFIVKKALIRYICSFYGPNYYNFRRREMFLLDTCNLNLSEKTKIYEMFNPHLVNTTSLVRKPTDGLHPNSNGSIRPPSPSENPYELGAVDPLIHDLAISKYIYCYRKPYYKLDITKNMDAKMKRILSNMETNYCSANISNIATPFEIKILDQICFSNDNFVSMVKTSIPYVQDGYLQTIKETGASYNTSLQIAERNYQLQKHINTTKSTFNAVESFIGGGASMITGMATGNAKMLVQGGNSAVFGTAGAIMDGVLGDMQIENQYQNTLDRAKAQRQDVANNATGNFTTYAMEEINYFGLWSDLTQTENVYGAEEYINYYGDLELAKKYFEWYGFACVPYEIPNNLDLESYIRVYATWLDVQTNRYVGLTPKEIQAVKAMLIQGVRVSTNGQIL